MKLLIISGSPKPGKNNTEVLLESFIRGFKQTKGNEVEVYRMNNEQAYKEAAIRFKEAVVVLVAFPLYGYAMPAGVKTFIEELEPFMGKCEGKKVGYLVQYGFKEAVHARPLEMYLEHISKYLGCDYLGTIIKGGCDGLSKSDIGNKEILAGAYEIGKTFGETGLFNKKQINDYSAPEVQKKQNIFIMGVILKIINKVYWEKSFKKNGVTYMDSFAKPYGK